MLQELQAVLKKNKASIDSQNEERLRHFEKRAANDTYKEIEKDFDLIKIQDVQTKSAENERRLKRKRDG